MTALTTTPTIPILTPQYLIAAAGRRDLAQPNTLGKTAQNPSKQSSDPNNANKPCNSSKTTLQLSKLVAGKWKYL